MTRYAERRFAYLARHNLSELPREFFERLKRKLDYQTLRIRSARVIAAALIEGKKMGKAQEIASRMKLTKERWDKSMDGVADKLDDFDKKEPSVVASAHGFLDNLHGDADALHAEMRQLSNLPLEQKK